jgi:hypothetical protein
LREKKIFRFRAAYAYQSFSALRFTVRLSVFKGSGLYPAFPRTHFLAALSSPFRAAAMIVGAFCVVRAVKTVVCVHLACESNLRNSTVVLPDQGITALRTQKMKTFLRIIAAIAAILTLDQDSLAQILPDGLNNGLVA